MSPLVPVKEMFSGSRAEVKDVTPPNSSLAQFTRSESIFVDGASCVSYNSILGGCKTLTEVPFVTCETDKKCVCVRQNPTAAAGHELSPPHKHSFSFSVSLHFVSSVYYFCQW